MVGLPQALPGTRLEQEGRLASDMDFHFRRVAELRVG
jgi:hypothetical protein